MADAISKERIIPVIFGPTAVGKTDVAIKIAQELDGEIISADSMQVYRGMDIGTSKTSADDLAIVPHYLISIRELTQNFSVVEFLEDVRGAVQIIVLKKKIPMIVGGTGMYLQSLIEGYTVPQDQGKKEMRGKLELECDKYGLKHMFKKLQNVDPHAAAKIHQNDKRRIIRALEVFELSGHTITKHQKKRRFMEGFKLLLIGLNRPRPELYKRIDKRVDDMLKQGLVDEVRGLMSKGLCENKTAFQALGYKETVAYINGSINYQDYVSELKKRTRNFARRQMTWFRRFSAIGPPQAGKGGSASPKESGVLRTGGKNVKWFETEKEFDAGQIMEYIKAYI
ncbi:MAG: tRNA (adenosine(37)-N6)-dimethylallyltransferase MiaA [bacterium]